ncbi:MAG: 50S ribosomal protein L7/L12 [Candidatus Harrisonbacteria bacterium CG10_big_fil_rev_8_21_14_0_10_38_8]|uniref:Large ribosomal subunit protein bL12 n=1 Tax=Candidatus Harrisonbacteria bacterium CG10_big_fil_rev_8_21_14_0_10_38_8 TaxID=1974582 RepID=A0A2M6WKT2_9BACT|nr:MAG: 50S ribosomal protein L7/L12 [Candidatus Harrisonbacteria bacterium CG10_big_fil_rev_8_21_14_0_10_38_8]
MAKIDDIINQVSELTVVELAELVKTMEEKFGISAAAPMAAAPAVADEGGKNDWEVVLTSSGENKIQVIKVVKEVTGKGLKEAKDMVDGAPVTIKAGLPTAEAEDLKKKIMEAGGTADLK